MVVSHSLECGCRSSCTIASLLSIHGSANSPSHPIRVKSSTSYSFSFVFLGTTGVTDLRLIEGNSTLITPAFAIAKPNFFTKPERF